MDAHQETGMTRHGSPQSRRHAPLHKAIIVSHGQPSDPDPAEAELAQFAARVAADLPDWQLRAATLAKPGALDAALAESGPAPLIYPFFMTAGWFTGDALRKRLITAPEAQLLPPFGSDPALPALTADLLRNVIADQDWEIATTRLFLAAHGSGRSPNAARDTQIFAAALAQSLPLQEIRVGFIEQPPFLADQAFDLGERSICLPFFVARGGHVIDDIPEALDLATFRGLRLDPIGCAAAAPALVARALAASRPEA